MSKHLNNSWIRVRDLYLDWLAEWPKPYNIKKLLNYKGYSLWWSSNLIKKDTIVNNSWIVDLYKKLEDKNLQKNVSIRKKRTPIYIFFVFILDIYRFFVIKLLLPRKNKIISDTFFYSIQLNLIKKDNIFFDRHYGGALSEYNSANLSSSYLLHLSNDYLAILNPYKYRKKIIDILNCIDSKVVILDSYLTIKDIFSVHFSVFKMYLLFLKEKKKENFSESFLINGISCADVLISELEQGFYGSFQSSLLSGIQFLNWSNQQVNNLTIISYLETLAAARPVYYFGRKSKAKCTFVALQHSTIYKNKIDFYNRREEFNYFSNDSISFSPQPDFYLLHGNQAKEMVSEFMINNQLEVIGCVKYDKYKRFVDDITDKRNKIRQSIGSGDKYTVVLAPSFGIDLIGMLEMFKDVKNMPSKIRFIISPHPLVSVSSIKEMISSMSINHKFEFYPEFSTQDLVIGSDLVVCGYSSIALEALIFQTSSIRVVGSEQIPLFENEDSIMYIENKADFWDYIYSNMNSKIKKKLQEDNNKLVEKFFYKIDGNAKDRMWNFLKTIRNN